MTMTARPPASPPAPAAAIPAVVICGGYGTRLREVTRDLLPKALVTVGGRTLLDRTLDMLRDAGVRDVVLVVAHRGDQIERHVLERPPASMRVRIARTDPPRGIIQDLIAACDSLGIPGPCWMTGCDELFDDVDLEGARERHGARGALVTTLVARGIPMSDRSVDARVADDGRILELLPPADEPSRHTVIGVSLLSEAFLARARELAPVDHASDRNRLLRDLLPALIGEGSFYGAPVAPAYYFHAGSPDALARAEAYFAWRQAPAAALSGALHSGAR